ncbi:MAG: DUF1552 domain-containing protein [Myxococcota bacterium]
MKFSRRAFLRTMGFGAGASLFLPFMQSIVHAQAMGAPRRFVIVVEGNAVEPISFLSDAMRTRLEADSTGSIRDKRWFGRDYTHDAPIIIPSASLGTARALNGLVGDGNNRPLESEAAVIMGLSSKVTGGGHTTHFGALSSTRSTAAAPGAATIDHVLGQYAGVRRGSPFDVLRLGISASNNQLMYQTCAFGKAKPAPVIVDPSTAFNQVFGSVASGAGQAEFQKRSELLDFAHVDATRALGEFSGNSAERAKLEQYLASIEEVTTRQTQLIGMRDTLNAVKPEEPDVGMLYQSPHPLDHLRAQFDIATAALLGGLTHVVVIASGTGSAFSVRYSSVISDVDRHNLHHQSGSVPEYLQAIHEVTRQHVAMIAKMARTLAATPEVGASGSMLDHTAILYMSDNGEQHHSKAEEWPMLLVGGRNLGFKLDGQAVIYPNHGNANNRQVSNMFNTLGFAAGETLVDFGGEGTHRIAEGELTELWSPM